MSKVVKGVLTIVQGFTRRDRTDFVKGLVSSGLLTKDEQDILVIESRRGDSTRSFNRFVSDMKRRGRLA